MPQLAENFERVVAEHTAGDPLHADVKWTNLTQQQIAAGLDEAGTGVSVFVVRKLLKRFGYRRRKASKVLSLGKHPDADAQFAEIAKQRKKFLGAGQPVLSIDTKKKELLGNFARPGELYAAEAVKVFDHDFGGRKRGVVIPHGIYDVGLNRGHVTLGTSHDTSQFAIDSLLEWWRLHGRQQYPQACELLLLCDGGGSNGHRVRAFKVELQRFANVTGWTVQVAHYPPYKSKYNPIEHRMFPHVDRSYRGVILQSVETVRDLVASTFTAGGLEVTASILRGVYQTGRKLASNALDNLRCLAHKTLPAWNYRIAPQPN
jgi:hypothetical protein